MWNDLIPTWSTNWFKINASVENKVQTFTITDTKAFVLVVTLSTQDNPKL